MAHIAISATIGPSGVAAAHRSVDGVDTDVSTVNDDVTAALANATISGDETALGLVTQIQTDMTTLSDDLAAGGVTSSHVLVSYDPAVVVSRNQLKAALDAIFRVAQGADDLT